MADPSHILALYQGLRVTDVGDGLDAVRLIDVLYDEGHVTFAPRPA